MGGQKWKNVNIQTLFRLAIIHFRNNYYKRK